MINSDVFGRTFWLDEKGDFRSAPTYISGKPDMEQSDYVSEWTDWEGVDIHALFKIHYLLVAENYEKRINDVTDILVAQVYGIRPQIHYNSSIANNRGFFLTWLQLNQQHHKFTTSH